MTPKKFFFGVCYVLAMHLASVKARVTGWRPQMGIQVTAIQQCGEQKNEHIHPIPQTNTVLNADVIPDIGEVQVERRGCTNEHQQTSQHGVFRMNIQ